MSPAAAGMVSASTDSRSAATCAVDDRDLALLGADQVGQAGVAGRPQVGAAGDLGAGREQHAGERERDRHQQAPAARQPLTRDEGARARRSGAEPLRMPPLHATPTPTVDGWHYAKRRARVQEPQEGRLHAAPAGEQEEAAQRAGLRLDHGGGVRHRPGLDRDVLRLRLASTRSRCTRTILEPGASASRSCCPASSWPPAGAEPHSARHRGYPQGFPRLGTSYTAVIPGRVADAGRTAEPLLDRSRRLLGYLGRHGRELDQAQHDQQHQYAGQPGPLHAGPAVLAVRRPAAAATTAPVTSPPRCACQAMFADREAEHRVDRDQHEDAGRAAAELAVQHDERGEQPEDRAGRADRRGPPGRAGRRSSSWAGPARR